MREKAPAEIAYSGLDETAALLGRLGCALAVSTYTHSRVMLFGQNAEGRPSANATVIERCMGLSPRGEYLDVAAKYGIWRFRNSLRPGQRMEGADAVYAPRFLYVTGALDIHDVCTLPEGDITFVNTMFSCLATTSTEVSFQPFWVPPFITMLRPEDRCHLNGLALGPDERPRWATMIAPSDQPEGWRGGKVGHGQVWDVRANRVVLGGLSMPHSPRFHRGRLWLHNSGTGEFGWADLGANRFVPICFCPGYLRGLSFKGSIAFLGLSLPKNKTFAGLPLEDRLQAAGIPPMCGVLAVDIDTGEVVSSLTFTSGITELYDVAVIEAFRAPIALTPGEPAANTTINIGPMVELASQS